MSSEHPFRNVSNPASLALCCPHCQRILYVAQPESLVTLTMCPHVDCQHVALLCTGEACGHDGSGALPFERFVEPRVRMHGTEIFDGSLACGLFVIVPMTMWAYAWGQGIGLLMVIVMFTGPAALIGLGLTIAMLTDAIVARRERRRIAAVRRHAFARARWETAYPNRTL